MAREFSRTERVGQQVHKEVASIIQNEYKHRVGDLPLITVSDVEVSRDLSYAKIYVTIYGEDVDGKAQIKQLDEAKGFIRSLLAKRIRMRAVPQLAFYEDKSITEGMRISNLVSEVIAKDEARHQDDEDEQQ